MTSHTVSLERSAYERLKAAKRPGESFSETVNRILETSRPSFRVLAGVLSSGDATRVRKALQEMRAQERAAEEARFKLLTARGHGTEPRH